MADSEERHGQEPPDPAEPGPAELDAAAEAVRRAVPPTPLVQSRALSRRYGREVHLKLESLSPVRSFKHRGALAAVTRIVREQGVVPIHTASTGNHGQGVAFAASRAGVPVTVTAPSSALDEKLQAMRELGAHVTVAGSTLSEAQQAAKVSAQRDGGVYLEDGEDPTLMAGAATVMSEVIGNVEMDTVLVPVGGGNLVAGSLLAAERVGSQVEIVGVQSTAAPSATTSWLAGRVVEQSCHTFAGGLATERPGRLALGVMRRRLRAMALVDDDDLYAAIGVGLTLGGCLMEGAAAAPLAALENHLDDIPGERVTLVVSGSWVSRAQIVRALDTLP